MLGDVTSKPMSSLVLCLQLLSYLAVKDHPPPPWNVRSPATRVVAQLGMPPPMRGIVHRYLPD
ncbi:hypothetical protein LIA77_04367 [Sarocladium implicatum]|nr:hypothetical protein LIA77_04367 [Sarocladium implicatum]